jgi:PGF-CTERM protein
LLEQIDQRGITGEGTDIETSDIEDRGSKTRTILGEEVEISKLETTVDAEVDAGDGQSGSVEDVPVSEHGIATTSDNATVTLVRRSTNGLATYAGVGADRSDLGSAAAVRDAIEGDALSRSERIAANDTVVYAVNASGLTGLPAARNATPETGGDLDRLDGIEFGVRSTADDDGRTASDALGETPRNSTVHVDETGLYVVSDGDDALPTDGEPEPGEEFTAEFRVTDDRLREAASDSPDGHRATATVAFDGTDAGDSSDDSSADSSGDGRERIASGDPITGGGGGGGTGGGNIGTGGSTGGATGDTESNGEGDERTESARGVGFGTRPNAERRTPHLNGPIAVSTPTAVEEYGVSRGTDATDATDATEDGTPSIDAEAAATGDDGSETASDETDDSDRETPTYENAPIRVTAEDVPGFGPLESLAALALALLAATRRQRGH